MNLLLTGLLFLALIGNGFASLKCYSCTECSAKKKVELTTCKNLENACIKVEKTIEDKKITNKGCIGVPEKERKNKCSNEEDALGHKEHVCVCVKDKCNDANVNTKHTKFIISVMLLTIVMQTIWPHM